MRVRAVRWPRDIAAVVRAIARADAWFWLDGSAGEPHGAHSLSYIGSAVETLHARRGEEHDFLTALRECSADGQQSIGCVAVFGYEFGVALMGEQPAADTAAPAFALRSEVVLVLDHSTRTAELRAPSQEPIDAWLEKYGQSLEEPPTVIAQPPRSRATTVGDWYRSDEQYRADIVACQDAIRAGDAYVLCLTDTVRCDSSDVHPLRLYERLRSDGASTRGAVIVAGERALVSVSPERFLSKRGRQVSTHPIKGTRPRGDTETRDAALAAELARDPKERAENLMIVDLMRNDLSRVCEPGSVRTAGFLQVEQHPRVHQLVSTIAGELKPEFDVFDLLRASFPGGSMTGAPKRRAVQLLAELEQAPRRLYSGCFGWLGSDSDAELAMTIRSIEMRGVGTPDAHAFIGAGGGVTIDSDPDAELAEKHLKAQSMIEALAQLL